MLYELLPLCIMPSILLNITLNLTIDWSNFEWLLTFVHFRLHIAQSTYRDLVTYGPCIDCKSVRGSLEVKSSRPVTPQNYKKHINVFPLDIYLLGIMKN